MGAPALLWPPLLLVLMLFGQLPVTLAQSEVCYVNETIFQVEENKNVTEPLVDIYVPKDQEVVLGPLSTPFAFRILGNQLFLNVTPDYEETPLLEAQLECRKGNTVVTQLRVFVAVLDVNDNAPEFSFTTKEQDVAEDTKVNTVVIPEADLQATDRDKDDILYYTLLEVTPGASSFFSLMGVNRPALKLDRSLDFLKMRNMTFQLLVRDTWEDKVEPSHTASATLVLNVVPADLRPPWFLPCSFSDGYICIDAQYRGVVPTGHRLPFPLILQPGPIYAVDGDQGINIDIIYSIIGGNTNDTFTINADSGNLTMAKSVSSPMTFILLVKAEQADLARYSVTQATVEARAVNGNHTLQFTQRLYRGMVELGSGAYTAVKDAASPFKLLRIQAVDPDFPDFNSAITHRITNCSEFTMDGDIVLTTVALEQARVFYAEVEAISTVTQLTATTVAEIRVSGLEPPSTESPPSPEPGGTTSSTASEVPGTSQRPTSTSSAGGTGPLPPSGTTLRPPASVLPTSVSSPTAGSSPSPQPATPSEGSSESPKPEISQPTNPTVGTGPSPQPATPSEGSSESPKPEISQPTIPTVGTGPSPQPATPGEGSAQTSKPGTSQPTTPTAGTSTSPHPATPGEGSAQTPKPGTSQPTATVSSRSPSPSGIPGEDGIGGDSDGQHFSTVDMAVLGGVLGALLLLALICLGILIHKHYGHRFHCCSGKAAEGKMSSFDNQAFLSDPKPSWDPTPDPEPESDLAPAEPPSAPPSPVPTVPAPPSPQTLSRSHAPESPTAAGAGDSPSAVRSILTKERRPESGYKAVWFGEDIGAEADVVVLNAPTAEADGAGDGGEGSDDEDDTDPNSHFRILESKT
uniref:cadherin-related family member 5 isoform X2 n=1 Tax=Jaculus jaculus TaxID=51337 RepID=UPI001E1B17DF|nr:cadherin-related family member 5 isoform X2 [Jaculus jaculus]